MLSSIQPSDAASSVRRCVGVAFAIHAGSRLRGNLGKAWGRVQAYVAERELTGRTEKQILRLRLRMTMSKGMHWDAVCG